MFISSVNAVHVVFVFVVLFNASSLVLLFFFTFSY